MILKKKWIELMQENNTGNYSLTQAGIISLIEEVDILFSQSVGDENSTNLNRIKNIYTEITSHFTNPTEADNYWADMPIFVSSWNWKDKSIFGETILRLTQYLGFYKKILTDKGLARSVVTHREYSNSGESDGTNKNFNSETPKSLSPSVLDSVWSTFLAKLEAYLIASSKLSKVSSQCRGLRRRSCTRVPR